MNSFTEIRVPHETVNDDFVTIVEWHTDANAPAGRGNVIVSIETSKAILEVEAETDGFLEILEPAGAKVAISAVIGRIHSQPDSVGTTGAASKSSPSSLAGAGATGGESSGAAPQGATISRKAMSLIERHGIDPSVFAGRGLVREADVIAYRNHQESKGQPTKTPSTSSSAEDKTGAAGSDAGHRLLHDASVSARERGRSLLWVGLNYAFRNWLLGNLVRWAPRGVILALHRLRGIKIGRDCFIDPNAIVETAYPENITLGNDVRITAGAVIMTHIKAPHYLRESGFVPSVLKPVVLEDHCFIGVNAVIMPGVTIGRASVVASGATVVGNVEPYTMVAGNPATVVRRFDRPKEQAEADDHRDE